MEHVKYISSLLTVCILAGLGSAQRLVVIAPAAVGVALNSPSHVNVSVAVIGGQATNHRVKFNLQKITGQSVKGLETTARISKGSLVPVLVPLPRDILQETRESGTSGRFRLVASCGTTTNRKESAELRTFLRSGFVFVQTDRPTYRRTETVRIRLLSTNEDMVPEGNAYRMEVTDPQNVTRVSVAVPSTDATYESSIVLDDSAASGDWSINVFHRQQPLRVSSAKFRVSDRVLNPFEMTVTIPDNIVTRDSTSISIHISARESFSIPVIGQASIEVALVKDGKKMMLDTLAGQLTDGKTRVLYDLSKVYAVPAFTFTNLVGSRLEVATVVKDDTGRFRRVVDRSVVFSQGHYKLEFPRLSLTRHPDVEFYPLEMVVRHYDGSPAVNTKVVVTADSHSEQGLTDEHGYFYKELLRPTLVKIVAGNDGMKKVERSLTITRSNTPDIKISPFRAEKKVGDMVHFTIARAGHAGTWFYTVMSRGQVRQSGSSRGYALALRIDASMVPHVTVTVWAVYGDVTVKHAATLTVRNACDEKFQVAVVYQGRDLGDADWMYPGRGVSIQFTGNFRRVALQAVDSLASENSYEADRTGRQIENALKNRYSVEETPLVLGTDDRSPRRATIINHRKKRSTIGCPWSVQQCRQKGRRSTVTSVDACLSHTYTVFSAYQDCSNACVNAHFNFCTRRFKRFARSSNLRSVGSDVDVPRVIMRDDAGAATEVTERSDFRTSMLFETKNLIERDVYTNRRKVAAQVPDRITRWYLTAVGVSEEFPLCVARANITVKKRNFMKLHLPSTAKVGEVINARVTVYRLAARFSRKKPRVNVRHQKGLCHNWGSETTSGRPWTTSWRLQPTRAGNFNVKVSYMGDRVRHTIRVKNAGEASTHLNIANITSSARRLSFSEIFELEAPTTTPDEEDDYDYTDYDDDDYNPGDYGSSRDNARSFTRSYREVGTNGDVHEVHLTIRPKITLTKWNMSIELLTGLTLDTQSLDKLKDEHAYLQSYKEKDGNIILTMDRMEKGSETDIKFLVSSNVHVPNRKDAEISINHEHSTGPVVVHRYNFGETQPTTVTKKCSL